MPERPARVRPAVALLVAHGTLLRHAPSTDGTRGPSRVRAFPDAAGDRRNDPPWK
jgi:hypothetical protein